MFSPGYLLAKFFRFLLVMASFSLLTTVILLAATPEAEKVWTVVGSVVASLFVAMYDFGLFHAEIKD